MHEVLVNRLEGLSLPRKSVVRLTDCPDMTLDVYRGHKTITQQHSKFYPYLCGCKVIRWWVGLGERRGCELEVGWGGDHA